MCPFNFAQVNFMPLVRSAPPFKLRTPNTDIGRRRSLVVPSLQCPLPDCPVVPRRIEDSRSVRERRRLLALVFYRGISQCIRSANCNCILPGWVRIVDPSRARVGDCGVETRARFVIRTEGASASLRDHDYHPHREVEATPAVRLPVIQFEYNAARYANSALERTPGTRKGETCIHRQSGYARARP